MRILIISNCRLGDSLVMIPALRQLRREYPGSFICLASEQVSRGFVNAEAILGDRGLVDEFVSIQMNGGWFTRLWRRLCFFWKMRQRNWDLGFVLIPPVPPLTMRLVERLSRYLRLCGARRIMAPTAIEWYNEKAPSLLAHVVRPDLEEAQLDYRLPPVSNPPMVSLPRGKRLLAVAPGANMPVNIWPVENYVAILQQLPENVHPVIFGGENERAICQKVADRVQCTLFVGRPMAEVEAAMRQCRCYLGNDTGLMHLAAACGLTCIAVFSRRNLSRVWEPIGNGHVIFRKEDIPCAGCLAHVCPHGSRECMEHDEDAVAKALLEAIASFEKSGGGVSVKANS